MNIDIMKKIFLLIIIMSIMGCGKAQFNSWFFVDEAEEEPPVGDKYWHANTSIINGLTSPGEDARVTIFNLDSDTYLITGSSDNNIDGYKWDGDEWNPNTAILNGLGIDQYTSPYAFYIDDDLYLIYSIGGYGLLNLGYKWDGDEWIAYSGIVNGLPEYTYRESKITVFELNDTTYMLKGSENGQVYGYMWDGSEWGGMVPSALSSTLPDIGGYSTPEAFYIDTDLCFLSGGGDYFATGWGFIKGYKWDGSSWSYDSDSREGLTFLTAFASPAIFTLNGNLYMLLGDYGSVDGFKGYRYY